MIKLNKNTQKAKSFIANYLYAKYDDIYKLYKNLHMQKLLHMKI